MRLLNTVAALEPYPSWNHNMWRTSDSTGSLARCVWENVRVALSRGPVLPSLGPVGFSSGILVISFTMLLLCCTLQLEEEVALVKAELQNTLLILHARNKELQELREKMQDVTEQKNQKEKENQVIGNDLKQLGQQLHELLSFLTETGKIPHVLVISQHFLADLCS